MDGHLNGRTEIKHCDGTIIIANHFMGNVTEAILSPCLFETQNLGIKTFQLSFVDAGLADMGRLVRKAIDAAAQAGAQLITCRCSEEDRASALALQEAGFRVIECLLTLGRSIKNEAASFSTRIRLSRASDADAVETIASSVFRFDRFHADPLIPDEAADRLKGAWARNSVNGRADAVFIAEEEGNIIGFNACLLRGETAIIDLLGVAKERQGRGIGRDLVAASLSYFSGKASRIIVGTQSANLSSLALYQGVGFQIETSSLTLHAHLN